MAAIPPTVPKENIYPVRPVSRGVFWTLLGIAGFFFLLGYQFRPQVGPHFVFLPSVFGGLPFTALKLLFTAALFAAVLTAWVAFSTAQLRVEIVGKELHLHGDLFAKIVPADDLRIDQAAIIDLADQKGWVLRLWGVSLPGYATGWYLIKTQGWSKALMLITDRHAVLRIPTRKNYTLFLSLAQNEALLARLQKYASRSAGSAES